MKRIASFRSSATIQAMQKEGKGVCSRCRGFMVPSFTDSLLVEITDKTDVPAWRCVNCGNWVDGTVAANRKSTTHAQLTSQNEIHPPPQRRWRWSVRLSG